MDKIKLLVDETIANHFSENFPELSESIKELVAFGEKPKNIVKRIKSKFNPGKKTLTNLDCVANYYYRIKQN